MSEQRGGTVPAGHDLSVSLERVLRERFSCRAFLDRPVPAKDIRRMFELAQRTASWCNVQPWKVVVTSGAATERLRTELIKRVLTDVPDGSDLPPPAEYRGEYQQRRRAAGHALYKSLGIAREDKERRREQMLLNYRFFGAPHVAVITSDAMLGPYGYVDCGGYIANLLNAAQSMGIATIAQAAVVLRAAAVHDILGIPQDRHLIAAVSFGYADPDHPANRFRTERADLEEVVEWRDS